MKYTPPADVVWLTTAPNPRVRSNTEDAGQRGWRVHAVTGNDDSTLGDVRCARSACGVMPSHGWGMDLFIERKCSRCLRRLGIDCTTCRGKGSTGTIASNTWNPCSDCAGTGERARQTAVVEVRAKYAAEEARRLARTGGGQ